MISKCNIFKYVVILFVLVPSKIRAQHGSETNLFERLQAISVKGIDYYNIDGITISCQITNIPFSRDNICRNLSIKEAMLTKTALCISQNNFVFQKVDTLCDYIVQNNTNYFVENEKGNITHIIFMEVGKHSIELQKVLTNLIIKRKIPKTVFNKGFFNTLNFAGRKVNLETHFCQWVQVNNIQHHYHGQMNWSVHIDSLDATKTVEAQRYITANCKSEDMKSLTDELINIVFEGNRVKARRITYQIDSELDPLLVNTGAGKTRSLTIYYIVAPVRGNYISCIMSHWNNDFIEEESGLPSLLEKFMKFENTER